MISVVVPIYNVEKYLNKCVTSILNQSYGDIEVILVDDGSPDSCGEMCDGYAKQDERIKVIHKENGGLSDARNKGLEAAEGEYVIFIDSDDYIEPDMLKLLITDIGDCDMATCGVFNDYASGSEPQYKGVGRSEQTDGISAFDLILRGSVVPATICNKLIKTSIAKNHRFPKGKVYEDAFYTNSLMTDIKQVHINTVPLYHYFHRANSITTTPFKERDMDIITAYEETRAKYGHVDRLKTPIEFRNIWSRFTVLDRILAMDNYKSVPQYKEIITYLKKNAFKAFKNPCFTKGRRISAVALKINVKLYRMLLMKNQEKNKRLKG